MENNAAGATHPLAAEGDFDAERPKRGLSATQPACRLRRVKHDRLVRKRNV
jgi:hypothetical protein